MEPTNTNGITAHGDGLEPGARPNANSPAGQSEPSLGAEHVLTFGRTPTGRYGSDGWVISGVSHDTWLSAFVSLHEAAHAGLNGSTAWGQLLAAIWSLPGRDGVVTVLVEACVQTHEAYATHSAVMGLLGRADAPTVADICARYPSYGKHLDNALRVGPHDRPDNLVRAMAADSVLVGCMQADVLRILLSAPIETFTASRISARDYPDSLLQAVLHLGADFWDGFDRIAADVFGHERWATLSEVSLRDAVDAGDRRRLGTLCSAHVVERFRGLSRPVLDSPAVLAALPRIVDEIARLSGPSGPPVIIDRDPTTLFDLEALRLRPPLPATVTDFGGSVTGDPMVVVRRADVFRRQYALRDDPLPPGREPVVGCAAASAGMCSSNGSSRRTHCRRSVSPASRSPACGIRRGPVAGRMPSTGWQTYRFSSTRPSVRASRRCWWTRPASVMRSNRFSTARRCGRTSVRLTGFRRCCFPAR